MSSLIPFINIILAAVLFFGVTTKMINNPLQEVQRADGSWIVEGGVKALQAESNNLNKAIASAYDLQQKIDDLNQDYIGLSQADKDRLNNFLPDRVDNIKIIVDLNSIAGFNKMTIRDVKISNEDQGTQAATQANAKILTGENFSVISFSVDGTYGQLQSFIDDLTRSLRVVDISAVSFTSADQAAAKGPGVSRYNIELRTYWFK